MTRKAFDVNDAVRERVRSFASVGVRQDDIARIIGCDPKTLRKYCRDELDRGTAEANAEIAGRLFAIAKAGNVVAQIFWLKTRAHWREREAPEDPIPGTDAGFTGQVVLILPDHARDLNSRKSSEKHKRNIFLENSGVRAANSRENLMIIRKSLLPNCTQLSAFLIIARFSATDYSER